MLAGLIVCCHLVLLVGEKNLWEEVENVKEFKNGGFGDTEIECCMYVSNLQIGILFAETFTDLCNFC